MYACLISYRNSMETSTKSMESHGLRQKNPPSDMMAVSGWAPIALEGKGAVLMPMMMSAPFLSMAERIYPNR